MKSVIILDPNHGGSDSGALGLHNLVEKKVVLEIAKLVKKNLKSKKISVLMTRNKDKTVSTLNRILRGRLEDIE